MSFTQFTYKKSSMANLKSTQTSNERKIYENLLLALLARNAYKLSKDNSKFRNFSIGRDVDLGNEGEFDDLVLSYMEQDDTKNLIFVTLEYRMLDFQIDSKFFSAGATKAKDRKRRSINLEKYFFFYLSVREKLKSTNDEELKNGKIKYVAIVTNVELNTEELSSRGIRLKEAPYDIINLFSLRKSSATTEKFHKCYQLSDINESLRKIPKKSFDSGSAKRELSRYVVEEKHEENKIIGIDDTSTDSNMCYQLSDISEDLCKLFKKNSHLHRLARELARYAVWEIYRVNKIMGIDETPIKYYHGALVREVIKKSYDVKLLEKPLKNEQYCEAQFRDDFLENDGPGPKKTLRDAIFEAVREMNKHMKDASDDQLKCILRQVKWKLAVNFGKTKQGTKNTLPREWMTVKEEDITDFLKCFVFVVNKSRRTDLEALFHATLMCDVAFMRILRKIEDAGLNWRERVDEVLEISKARKWVTGEEITNAIEEQEQSLKREIYKYVKFSKQENLNFTDLATAVTLTHEHEMHQYGKFSNLENFTETLNRFLLSSNQILCINTTEILLSCIKILQILDAGLDNEAEGCRISVDLDILKSKLIREHIIKSFMLENNNLITIECRHSVDDQDVVEFYYKLSKVVRDNPKKKVIIIVQQEGHNILLEKFKKDFQNKEELIVINDSIDLKDFVPVEDPLQKKLLVFQGQKQRVSLAELTGIDSWKFYSQERFQRDEIIDGTTFVKILSNDEIEIGSKPLGTCNLSGAYATLFEEVNAETLANKLLPKESDDNIHEMYIMSGISGSSKQEKIEKMIECLGLTNMKEITENQLGDIDSDSRIKIADDIFKDEDFKAICHKHPEKEIFWIYIKDEQKVILQKFYNPNFYLKRKFKNVVIKNEVIELLMDDNLAEIFIFSPVNDLEKFYISLGLTDEKGKRRVEDNNKCSIYFSEDDDAMAAFKDLCRKNKIVHWLKFEEDQLVWCDSYGSVNNLRKFISHGKSEISLVEEDNLIKEIKNKKLVIIADDPGTGKTTTITKLYESKHQSTSFIETHWIVKINIMENLQAIRDIKFSDSCIDIARVVNFLSKVDVKLNNNLAKNLLEIALDKNENFLKPILIVIDGFDEVLDEVHRNKVVSLLKFLKNETAAKLWITTRTHFKYFLEDELSTFAIQFNPLGTDTQFTYIKMYLEDRLRLILNEKKFDEFFTDSGKMPTVIQKFFEAFLKKMISVFKMEIFNLKVTPLQLHLMLEGSITHFKYMIDIDDYQNFNYLGNDAWEVHENFIYRKYDVFFQKVDMKDYEQRRREKFLLNMYCKELAISLIFKLEPKNTLKAFQDSALSIGIIMSDGSNIEFTHTSFRDYFASEVFIDWMIEKPNELSSTKKHEYILKEILKRPDFQLVRTFINIKLKKITEGSTRNSLEEITQHYGKIIEELLTEEQSTLVDEEGTLLHIAIKERNEYIACFLLNSLKEQRDVLKKFLLMCDKNEETVLHFACKEGTGEIVRILLDAAAGISEGPKGHKGVVKEFIFMGNKNGETALHFACKKGTGVIVRILLDAAAGISEHTKEHKTVLKEFLFMRDKEGGTALHASCKESGDESKRILLDAMAEASGDTEGHKRVLKEFIFMSDENGKIALNVASSEKNRKTALHISCEEGGGEIVRILLDAAAGISENTEGRKRILKEFLFMRDKNLKTALHVSCEGGGSEIVRVLLDAASGISEDTQGHKTDF